VAGSDAVVLGAGVIGLTSALCLAEAGLEVSCWAAERPQQSTSSVAGALWANSPAASPGDRLTRWTQASLSEFRELDRVPDSGVRIASGIVASRELADPPPPQMFPTIGVRPRDPVPEGYASAFELEVPLIDMSSYLDYLQARLRAAGSDIEIRRVGRLEQAAAVAPVVVNCTGLGARELVGDHSLQAVRGQHVVVENPGVEEFFIDDRSEAEWTCWFPHGDRVVLGGIAQPGLEQREPDPAVAARILERCAAVEPRFARARVLGHQVGLRPARPQVRLESEVLAGSTCVHNYGHGRSGVSLSWACAREVQALVAAVGR
jgi:D-amino-acid oxidase